MYSKLYRTIFDGSLYGEFEGLTVFMAMLALADKHGEVDAAPTKIAGCLGCDVEFVLRGIDLLEAPDPISRTPAEEGRRLIRLKNDEGGLKPFGWKITNYEKYRSIRNEEERRAYKRNWDRKNRSKKSEPTKSDHARPKPTYTEAEAEAEALKTNTSEISQGNSTRNRVPFQKIIDLYHRLLPSLPKVEVLTDTRKGYLRQRWTNDLKDLSQWENYFNHVKQSDFLMGKAPSNQGRRPFRANLEWLTKPNNFAKVAEDNYHG